MGLCVTNPLNLAFLLNDLQHRLHITNLQARLEDAQAALAELNRIMNETMDILKQADKNDT